MKFLFSFSFFFLFCSQVGDGHHLNNGLIFFYGTCIIYQMKNKNCKFYIKLKLVLLQKFVKFGMPLKINLFSRTLLRTYRSA